VILGGEDAPAYVWNFISLVQENGYLFVRVNAFEAKKRRSNTRTVSDALALDGICQTILEKRAYDIDNRDDIYTAMKKAARNRRRMKCAETAMKNRIHTDVSLLFPGFLSAEKSGLTPFGRASLSLMGDNFSVLRFRRMRPGSLARKLERLHVRHPAETAGKLVELAAHALPAGEGNLGYFQKTLRSKVDFLTSLRNCLRLEENELARHLVQTPGFYLTSMSGFGIILAGGIVAELGNPVRWPSADKMSSYAGIVARHYQTGGPDSPAVPGRLPIDANHQLKDQILQAAHHAGQASHPAWRILGLPGEHPLREHYCRIAQRGGCTGLSTAKQIFRIARNLVLRQQIYLPKNALPSAVGTPGAMPVEQYIQYLQIVSEMLVDKWKRYDLSGIPDGDNQLTHWQQTVDDIVQSTKGKQKKTKAEKTNVLNQ
jgi:transposase